MRRNYCDVCEQLIPESKVEPNTVLISYGDPVLTGVGGELLFSEKLELCEGCLAEFKRMLQFFKSSPRK